MVGKQFRLFLAAVACFLTLALLPLTIRPTWAQAATVRLKAHLSGAQEVPPVASPGTGLADLVLDPLTGQLRGLIIFAGLTSPVTAAVIHGPAPAGMNAAAIAQLPIFPAATSGTYTLVNLVSPLTPAQMDSMLHDLTYLNLHTSIFPGGEIRGQLVVFRPLPGVELLLD